MNAKYTTELIQNNYCNCLTKANFRLLEIENSKTQGLFIISEEAVQTAKRKHLAL